MHERISADFLGLQAALAGRYSLERELGRGGMGVVFLAHEVALDRPIALKLLPDQLASDDVAKARFLQEARTAAKLSHPNIVPIYTVDQVDDYVFYAMALVDGETLGERVRSRGPLTDSEATRLLREVAWALSYAHAQGVVHRDVKPDNILLENDTGRALVMDFGIAQVGAPLVSGELAEQVQGTAEFMSPEQARGAAVDARSDLYSLGALGFYVVTGRAPFEAPSPSAVLGKHVAEPAPTVASVAPHVATHLARTIDRCLRKDPARRFQNGGSVAEALSHASASDRPLPVPLRVFIKHLRGRLEISPVAALFLVLWLVPVLLGMLFTIGATVGLLGLAAIVSLFPLTLLGGLIPRARKVLKAGHTVEDVRLALQQDVIRRNEEFRFDVGERETVVDRGAKRLAIGAGVAGVSLLATASFVAAPALLPFGTSALLLAGGAAVFRSVRARRRADVTGERWLKVLSGRFGDWLFKVSGIGLKDRDVIAAGTYRPTEMAISISAARLFDELPKESRRELAGLPDAVNRLENDARTLREQLVELDAALDEIGDDPAAPGSEIAAKVRAEVEQTRGEAQTRLREVVKALETIRLGLLRMHAGERVLQSVTMELESARGLSADMSSLLDGHREVERLLAEGRATGAFKPVSG